jgi:hypothetical protein
MCNNPIYWKQRNGVLISIDDMDVNHLRNVLKLIVNNSSKHKEQFSASKYLESHNIMRGKEFNQLKPIVNGAYELGKLNGEAANMFNDDMKNYQDECDETEIDIY